MPETTDPAASALQPIRDRAGIVAKLGPPRPGGDLTNAAHRSAADVPRLLAAVDAALKPHQPGRVTILGGLCERHENHRHFSITSTEADGVRACPDCAAEVWTSCAGCGPMVSVDACPTRNSITAALTGKETTDGG